MDAKPNFDEALQIGYSGDICWKSAHRPDKKIVYFVVSFEELSSSPDATDHRVRLGDLWAPFLNEASLSASICHHCWHPENGFRPSVVGWVWRHHKNFVLGDITDEESMNLSDLLRSPASQVTGFNITEMLTTQKYGKNIILRKLRINRGEFLLEEREPDAPSAE